MENRAMHLGAIALLVAATAVPVRAQVSTDALQSITSAVQARQYERALKLIEGALGQSPNDVRLWTLQGMARSGLGNDGEAIISFNHALKLKQDYLPALEGVAQIEYLAGNARGAIPLLRRVLLLRPADQTAHAMLAAMAYKQRDCQSSVEHFGRAATVISSQALALDQYATCLAVLKRPEEAISVLQKLVTLKPADPQVRMKLATIEFNNQRASDVIQTLRPLVESATPDPDALELVSAAYEAVGDTPRAVEALRKAIGLAPRVNYYLDFADLCLVHGSFQVGIDIVNGGLSLLPDSAPLYLARGILLIQLGKYEQAETDFETAQRIDPNQALGPAAKALAKIQQNNLDQALETVQLQLRQKPTDAFVHYLLAEILVRRGASEGSSEMDQAIAAAAKAVQLDPDLALAHNVLARLYLKSGRVSLAIEQSRLALRADPSDQTALYHLILALRRSGKSDEIPPLLKRFTALREHAAKNRSRLFELGQSPVSPDER